MDYDALLQNSCPAEYVALAKAEDLSRFPQNDVLGVVWAQSGKWRPDCLNALIVWFAPRIGPRAHEQQIRDWLGYLAGYEGRLPAAQLQVVVDALLRLAYDPKLAKPFFEALIVHGIDIRAELAARVVPDWAFARPESQVGSDHTWHYFRYLAVMAEPGAYRALADKVAATGNANAVMMFLDSLAKLRTPEARAILEQYRHDPRNIITASGKAEPLAASVAVMLDFGRWN